ncbi:MAG: hypothetical protein ACYCTF_06110 [Acidiferrobacter sp.]
MIAATKTAARPLREADVRVELTASARRALDARAEPLLVEMELFFSCLIRKRLRFGVAPPDEVAPSASSAHPRLVVWFRPVMARHCALPNDAVLDELPLMDFPLERRDAFRPRWVTIDYRGGGFCGDFGW